MPEAVKSIEGAWNDTKKENEVLLAADVSPAVSVLIDKYKHKLRIQFFDKMEQIKNLTS